MHSPPGGRPVGKGATPERPSPSSSDCLDSCWCPTSGWVPATQTTLRHRVRRDGLRGHRRSVGRRDRALSPWQRSVFQPVIGSRWELRPPAAGQCGMAGICWWGQRAGQAGVGGQQAGDPSTQPPPRPSTHQVRIAEVDAVGLVQVGFDQAPAVEELRPRDPARRAVPRPAVGAEVVEVVEPVSGSTCPYPTTPETGVAWPSGGVAARVGVHGRG